MENWKKENIYPKYCLSFHLIASLTSFSQVVLCHFAGVKYGISEEVCRFHSSSGAPVPFSKKLHHKSLFWPHGFRGMAAESSTNQAGLSGRSPLPPWSPHQEHPRILIQTPPARLRLLQNQHVHRASYFNLSQSIPAVFISSLHFCLLLEIRLLYSFS